jgi:putative hydrolase of the HAD superfamily
MPGSLPARRRGRERADEGIIAVIEVVVLDLDDTLYPERAFAFSGFDAVARRFADRLGSPGESAEHMRRLYDSPHRARVFNELCRPRGLADDVPLIAAMIETYRGHAPRIELFDDAVRLLDRLTGRYRLALITDGPLATQQAKVDALSLAERLEEIILTDGWGRAYWKPHPRAFEHVERRFGVPGERCVYVADNPAKDFVAPRARGWRTIRIVRADGVYRDAVAPADGGPEYSITSLDELDSLLASG